MAASYTYTCYVVDTSPSMGLPMFPDDPDDTRTRLECALQFVRVKLAQRLINPKKTDQVAVVLFGGHTKNALAVDDDLAGYENIEEYIRMEQPSFATMAKVEAIQLGETDVDLIAALYVGGNVVRTCKAARKDASKVVVLLTDADEPAPEDGGNNDKNAVLTSWDDPDWLNNLYNAVVPGRSSDFEPKDQFRLGIIGTDFGDPSSYEQDDSTWSRQKAANVRGLQKLYTDINGMCSARAPRAHIGDVLSAIEGASAPSVAPIKTPTKLVQLIIGDPDEHPEHAVSFEVEVQKAVQKAAGRSMQKMRKGKWTKDLRSVKALAGKKRRRDEEDGEVGEEDEDDEARDTFHQDGAMAMQKLYYYQPYGDKADKTAGGEGEEDDDDADDDGVDEAEKAARSEAARRLETEDNLARAYKYGADLIPISKDDELESFQFPAGAPSIQVRGFVKASEFRPEWSLNDPFWVFGASDNRARLLFSSMLWGMKESKTHALVRVLKPKDREPRLCLLLPLVGEEAISERLELGLLVTMPFKEEIANWSFPSLDRIMNTSGRQVTEHRLLPTSKLLETMDSFVDSMMLPVYADDDGSAEADGSSGTSGTVPWFDPNSSYNPAIHNQRDCLIHKLLNPEASISADHEVSPHLARFLFPPDEVMEASADAALDLSKAANLSLIPPKPKVQRGAGGRRKQAARPTTSALEDILGADSQSYDIQANSKNGEVPESQAARGLYKPRFSESQSQAPSQRATPQQTSPAGKPRSKSRSQQNKAVAEDDGSATEASATEGEDTTMLSNSDNEATDGDADGDRVQSLISWDAPLKDYNKLLEQPGMITPANRNMFTIIPRFLKAAKSEKDLQKIIDCLKRLREVVMEEDEVDYYHPFLYGFKKDIINLDKESFLARMKSDGLGLVTKEEVSDEAVAGTVSKEEAKQFWT